MKKSPAISLGNVTSHIEQKNSALKFHNWLSPTVGMHKVGVYRSTGTEQGLLEFIWMEGCSGR